MRSILTIALVFTFGTAIDSMAIDAETIKNSSRSYITTGNLQLPAHITTLSAVLMDFNSYNTWALQGLNGEDQISSTFIGLLKGIRQEKPMGKVEVIYDINLPWPASLQGNTAKFDLEIVDRAPKTNHVTEFRLRQPEKTLTVEKASLQIKLVPQPRGTCVHYRAEVKFPLFIDLFFSLTQYKKNVEWRIVKLMQNLVEHLPAPES